MTSLRRSMSVVMSSRVTLALARRPPARGAPFRSCGGSLSTAGKRRGTRYVGRTDDGPPHDHGLQPGQVRARPRYRPRGGAPGPALRPPVPGVALVVRAGGDRRVDRDGGAVVAAPFAH